MSIPRNVSPRISKPNTANSTTKIDNGNGRSNSPLTPRRSFRRYITGLPVGQKVNLTVRDKEKDDKYKAILWTMIMRILA